MYRILFIVGLGGAIGSILRYLAYVYLSKLVAQAFPFGTFVVNIFGCLAIGVVFGLSERFKWLSPEWRLFLATGICGGFTTFSAFAYENIKLLQNGNYTTFFIYSLLSFVFGLLAVLVGMSLTKI